MGGDSIGDPAEYLVKPPLSGLQLPPRFELMNRSDVLTSVTAG
jgi:hypothetical protein